MKSGRLIWNFQIKKFKTIDKSASVIYIFNMELIYKIKQQVS